MYIYPVAEIRNILFDFGNVLFDLDIPGATERLKQLAREEIPPDTVVEHFTALAHLLETGSIAPEAFATDILQVAKPDVTADDIVDAWNSMLIGMPRYRFALLESLRERYSVYLLSNTNVLHFDWVHTYFAQSHGVTAFEQEYLDGAYYSHLMHQRKPDKGAFLHVIEDSFLTPAQTLFIDDMKQNINAAHLLGFKTHHSPPDEEIAEYLKSEGFY